MNRAEQQQADIESVIGDKYQVLGRIGGGGMAQVLLARHRLHGGLFAIKILADHLAQDPSIVARFKQEATAAALLSGHPNIVTIFDIGEGSGLHYLIMQFVSGEDLASYTRREGKLAPAAAAGVIAQAAEALLWAESKRIVHRDLKPANIYLDIGGRIKILDFGISKITDVADGLTRPGESLGTPFYMSPEQIRGESCDVRSDLYSLGVVFFELLTGRRPFENESATAIQIAHLSVAPPLLLDIDPTLPPMCEQIVQKLLRKDRLERYQSAQELLTELYAHGASSGPTILRPITDPELQKQIDFAALTNPGSITNKTSALPTIYPISPQTISPAMIANAPPSEQPAQIEPAGKSKLLVSFAIVAALLLVAIGLVLTLRGKPKTQPSTASTESKQLEVILEDPTGRMLLVPGGDFIFGEDAPDSPRPKQTLSLPAFYIDQTEVSNAQYLRFAKATNRPFSENAPLEDPVVGVSATDAEAYAAWTGKRLPSEEEWEKAARGTDGRPFPWGSEPWKDDVPDHLQPVSSFPERKSPSGALNMAGNAWEWTSTSFPAGDRELSDMTRVLKTSSFSKTWMAIKGGSFSPNGSAGFRVYLRRGFPQDQHSLVIGFRCAKNASSQ